MTHETGQTSISSRSGTRDDLPHALGDAHLDIDALDDLARGKRCAVLGDGARMRIEKSMQAVRALHDRGDAIYGVTTSVGASVDTNVPSQQSDDFSLNLLRMHGCGTGSMLSEDESAAVMLVQLNGLAQGKSGIRPVVLDHMLALLKARALPLIPSEGSVGASGDLTPMSYVAAVLVGEREVRLRGRTLPAREALSMLGLPALRLVAKEALSLMNGTGVSSALAGLGFVRARRIARLSSAISVMASFATRGNRCHFDTVLHAAKPHPGQGLVARWMDRDFDGASLATPQRLQDRYSIRCAPQVIGVLVDALRFAQTWIETEINGVSDNPIVDVDGMRVVHGGNFYGGHIGFVCDALKVAVANVACLLDRQVQVLCNPAENGELPANLVGVRGPGACIHNGFKALTIATSSMAAEAMKMTMPASAFARSTELHNQDKVPMATLSARELSRIIDITEQVAACAMLVCAQACDLRRDTAGEQSAVAKLSDRSAPAILHAKLREQVPAMTVDRRLDTDIHKVLALLRADALCPRRIDIHEDLGAGPRRNAPRGNGDAGGDKHGPPYPGASKAPTSPGAVTSPEPANAPEHETGDERGRP